MSTKRMTRAKGQSLAEYAILLAVVVGATVAMQVYNRRTIQAQYKQVGDKVAADIAISLALPAGGVKQYEPYYASSNYTVGQARTATERTSFGGILTRSDIDETTTRTGQEATGGASTLDSDNDGE
jgi:hypothetical protein